MSKADTSFRRDCTLSGLFYLGWRSAAASAF
jgi:hypothetical protein